MHCFLSFVLFLRWCFHARLLLEPCWTLPCLCRLWSLNERRFCTASFRHPLWIVGGFCRLARQWPSRQTSYLLHFYIVHEAQREGFHGKSLVFSWSFVLRSMIPPWHLSCAESERRYKQVFKPDSMHISFGVGLRVGHSLIANELLKQFKPAADTHQSYQ